MHTTLHRFLQAEPSRQGLRTGLADLVLLQQGQVRVCHTPEDPPEGQSVAVSSGTLMQAGPVHVS